MSDSLVLRADRITKTFPGVKALEDVSFDLRRGEVHSLCGENGAGKSTLIKTLSGIWATGSYEGAFYVDDNEARFKGIADAEAAGVAVIYQELALVSDMTVAENIYLGHEPTRFGFIDWDRMYADAAELLGRFGIDIDPAERVGNLGVGKQQLVEIVKALKKESHILILDEPTAALTEREVEILLNMVREIRARGIACIYISHKLDEVFAISDRITVLRDGKSIVTLDAAATDQNEVIRNMVGREIEDLFPFVPANAGEEILRVDDLTVQDEDGRDIVKSVSLNLRRGEVLGLGGLMGAGRSELLMNVLGADGTRTGGTVNYRGQPFNPATPQDAIRAGLVMVTEDRKRYGLVLDQSNSFNFSLASLGKVTRRSGMVDVNQEVRRNEEISRQLRVKAPTIETETGTLSGGNQQKVVLGKALLCEPDVIFLDEPTRGIDVGAKLEVYELINALKSRGKAVVLVSSEMPELMGLSDRIIMLAEGRVGGTFARADFSQEKLLAAAIGADTAPATSSTPVTS
ncbi:sugar ABC transporter ATP-binding protein [Synoicihabitans lomoniglobus]|uniref:Sugar ABC transporter ATP-binding protein n=1 Tax=Synoicihabitans lomoniglobus TaxID=2909285 RepID=A0AAF0CHG1_9BACT|nr:ATP-binding cassette domain-containing protein [Opitutaceae bacterium LMO-M01]WED64277.1 sugar ABC transporter ATP-binding protein [Opitutaceae bacterium LMO-M01]